MIKTILPEELHAEIQQGKTLSIIDVREDDEVAKGIIPGAKHIPLGQLEDRLNEINKDDVHIMVCRSGGRSGRACEFLDTHGMKVKNMVGGMISWEAKFN